MGCVSSSLLEGDGAEDDRRRIISHHHIVSLTSSTYGILTTPGRGHQLLGAHGRPRGPLHAGQAHPPSSCKLDGGRDHQRRRRIPLRAIDGNSSASKASPPLSSASAVVLYTTSLRGVRATFEACNAVRAALQAHGVAFRERDVSMDRGFRDELRSKLGLLGGARAPAPPAAAAASMLPRLFVRGRHVGGAEDVLRLDEEGLLAPLLDGLPRARGGGGAYCCDGCGGMRFLPCFDCSGSRKLAVTLPVVAATTASCRRRKKEGTVVVVRCGECNENGLVLCPICS
ncbi:unnamed protein product [Miscanthus lutarioriparius]|uniref:Glutaredoxin domain-containing protein n=1 Tax=Miscanthus lutarioriparius TaxID=422564 RepID=A0A811PX07_9POAL|nr:unnamed protein product [Miscanthus lutarioriparius]